MLADDPGTAVLTLTANGMVERSRPTGMPPSSVVALWKDPTRGLREISLDPGATGVLVSVAATRARRRVADGRTPVDNATGLMVAGVFPVHPAQEVVPHATAERTRDRGGPRRAGPHDRDRDGPTRWPRRWSTLPTRWARWSTTRGRALPGAASSALPEPSASLARALTAVADTVAAADAGANGARDAAILALLQTAPADGDAPASLARAVLRSALEARQDARSVVSRHG